MESVSEQIKKKIQITLKEQFDKEVDISKIQLVHPEDVFGDYSTNIALVLSKELKMSPMIIAERIVSYTKTDDVIEKIEAVKPGFINIFLPIHLISNDVLNIANGINNLKYQSDLSDKKVVIEFGQPNTHKVPTIGHLYSYVFGSTLANLLELQNADVIRVNYQGDVGPHVAKCLWAYMKGEKKEFKSLDENIDYIQLCYQQGSAAYEDDPALKEEINHINKLIYNRDSSIMSIWQSTRELCIEYLRLFENRLGIKYEKHYFESEVYENGKKLVLSHLGDIFFESDGAIIFNGDQYGLHKRVFITQKGNTTYEAKDLALARQKFEDWNFDLSIVTTATEQNEYFKVINKALEVLSPNLEGKLKHIGFGMINLKGGKMSSRTGNIITGVSLIEEIKTRIKKFLKENRDYDDKQIEDISEKVAIASIKYSFLKVQYNKDISFDMDQSISYEGDSAPYILYTYARSKSIFKEGNLNFEQFDLSFNNYDITKEEVELYKILYKFPEIIESASLQLEPHIICAYLFEMAQNFNRFYLECNILKEQNENIKMRRLSLTKSYATILQEGFRILSIDVIEKL